MSNYNLANLVMIGGMLETKYEKCKDNIISNTMHEFRDKELKDRAGNTVRNKSQAIAIALNQSHSQCDRNSSDVKKLIKKVNEDLNDMKPLNLSNIIETHDAIIELNRLKKSKRAWIFKKLLWDKIIKMNIDNIKIDTNIWEEIKKIHEL